MKHFTEFISVSEQQSGVKKQTAPATLTAYLLDPVSVALNRKRPAVVICPGGAYSRVSDREGEPVAMQFLSMGCHVFILRYSVAPDVFPLPQMEAALSVALIRSHAKEWLVDPDKILLCGFSAGGHLACSLGVFWNQEFLYGPLNVSPQDIQPNGLILAYPVITSGPFCHKDSFLNLLGSKQNDENLRQLVSLELQAGLHTPKTFLWHTSSDDCVPVQNSYLFAQALDQAGVPVEMHIYPEGCHGLSLANKEVSADDGQYIVPVCQDWINKAKVWMESL